MTIRAHHLALGGLGQELAAGSRAAVGAWVGGLIGAWEMVKIHHVGWEGAPAVGAWAALQRIGDGAAFGFGTQVGGLVGVGVGGVVGLAVGGVALATPPLPTGELAQRLRGAAPPAPLRRRLVQPSRCNGRHGLDTSGKLKGDDLGATREGEASVANPCKLWARLAVTDAVAEPDQRSRGWRLHELRKEAHHTAVQCLRPDGVDG